MAWVSFQNLANGVFTRFCSDRAGMNHPKERISVKIYSKNKSTGEECELSRDVCHEHPDWVHAQAGTASESELQAALDQYDIRYYYDSDGEYKGEDICGIGMRFEDTNEADKFGIPVSIVDLHPHPGPKTLGEDLSTE